MSKYTYHIAFNVSDYTEVFPENRLKENGFWEGETWIDRVEISEVRLHKYRNETTYATIASWVTDPSKYQTDCFFKIQKSGVDWHTYIFRIRWGFLDSQTGVYRFNPQAYDSWYRYYGFAIEENCASTITDKWGLVYSEFSGGSPVADIPFDSIGDQNKKNIFDTYNTVIPAMGTGLTVKSSLLNTDSTSVLTVTTTNGKQKDYVTGQDNYFLTACFAIGNLVKKTVKSVIEYLEVFQIFPFFESATVLRLEHVKYLLTQLQSNAVSLTLDADEQEVEFLDKSVPYLEKLTLYEDETNTDTDFENQIIKYTENKKLAESITEISNSLFTDYQKYVDDVPAYIDQEFLLAGHQQEMLEFTSSGAGGTWTFSENTFSFAVAGGSPTPRYMISNDIKTVASEVYNCSLTLASTQPTGITCYFADRANPAVPISNIKTLAIGANVFDLTINTGGLGDINDATFVMTFIYNTITLSGWVTVKMADANNTMRVAWDLGSKSGNEKLNAPFAQSNIIENWWNIYRPTNTGVVNGVSKAFTDSQFIMRRQLKRRYWPDDINMQYGINDGSRIAKIERYVRDLDTDFVEFTLLYQEYE